MSTQWLYKKLETEDYLSPFASQLLYYAALDDVDQLISHWRPGIKIRFPDDTAKQWTSSELATLQQLPVWPNTFTSKHALRLAVEFFGHKNLPVLLESAFSHAEDYFDTKELKARGPNSFAPVYESPLSDPGDLALFEELLRGMRERVESMPDPIPVNGQEEHVDAPLSRKLSAQKHTKWLASALRKWMTPDAPWSLIELLDELDPQPPEKPSAPQALQLSLAALADETSDDERYDLSPSVLSSDSTDGAWESIPTEQILDALDKAEAITTDWDIETPLSYKQQCELNGLRRLMLGTSDQVTSVSTAWLNHRLATEEILSPFASHLLRYTVQDSLDSVASHWRQGTKLQFRADAGEYWSAHGLSVLQKLPVWSNTFRSDRALRLLIEFFEPNRMHQLLESEFANAEDHFDIKYLEKQSGRFWANSYTGNPISDPDDLKLFEALLRGMRKRVENMPDFIPSDGQEGQTGAGMDRKLSAQKHTKLFASILRKWITPDAPESLLELLDKIAPLPAEGDHN